VSRVKVRSLVLDPEEGATLPRSETSISGIAWSGAAPIAGVEVDVGEGWMAANVEPSSHPHAPRRWSVSWTCTTGTGASGDMRLVAPKRYWSSMTSPATTT